MTAPAWQRPLAVSNLPNLPNLAALVREATVEDLPALCGRLREAELMAEMRLREAERPGGPPANMLEPERWISAEVAAGIASVPVKRLYEWASGKKWAARPTKRCLRIEEAAFRRWLGRR